LAASLGTTLTCKSNYYNTGTAPTVTCTSCGPGAATCTSNAAHTTCLSGWSKLTG